MRVLVTGGTGFVGCHTTKALIDAGHDVKLLVRARERIRPALEPLGIGDVDYSVGDVTDRADVETALSGCDAVVHAASVYALSSSRAAEMERVNSAGTEVVLGLAHEAGLDPIVHVSSYAALLPPPRGGVITADSPVGRPAGPYGRSKADSERIARRLQDRGAPVVITHPGVVWGPHDPHMGETTAIARMILRGRMPVLPGRMPVVDVRDVAAGHAAVMQPGAGPRRFLLTGEDLSFAELFDTVRRVTGRRLRALRVPRAIADAALGARARVPASAEGPWFALQRAQVDASETQAVLGVRFRPAQEAIADTIRWLHGQGHLTDRQAGHVAVTAEVRTAHSTGTDGRSVKQHAPR
jgi:dihydroflavonol-4-reductase